MTSNELLQNNERFCKNYTVFTFKFNGVPIKFVALKDAERAMAEQKRLILEEGKKSLDQTHKESKNWKALTDEEKTVYSAWEAAITDYQEKIKKI